MQKILYQIEYVKVSESPAYILLIIITNLNLISATKLFQELTILF